MGQINSAGLEQSSMPRPVSAVEEALGVLEGTISGLGVAADQIESRLASILSPEHPVPTKDCAKEGSAVPLAMNIMRQTDRVQNITDQLQSVLSRLGV